MKLTNEERRECMKKHLEGLEKYIDLINNACKNSVILTRNKSFTCVICEYFNNELCSLNKRKVRRFDTCNNWCLSEENGENEFQECIIQMKKDMVSNIMKLQSELDYFLKLYYFGCDDKNDKGYL